MHDEYEIRKNDIANGVSEMLMIWRISLSRQDLNFPSAIFRGKLFEVLKDVIVHLPVYKYVYSHRNSHLKRVVQKKGE